MGSWDVGTSYPPELRERAVRMVAEVRPEYPSDWPAIKAVAGKLGIGNAETEADRLADRARDGAGEDPCSPSSLTASPGLRPCHRFFRRRLASSCSPG
jgi:transposase-like protein